MSEVQIIEVTKGKMEERWRSKDFIDLVGNKENIENIEDQITKGVEMPHFLFFGPAGTGKSSISFIMLKKILGHLDARTFKRRHIRTNSSAELTIDFIKNVIIPFCESSGPKTGLKIIILDEIDGAASKRVQESLRDILENPKYKYVKFILICNFIVKIINPIKSRCACYEFMPIKVEDMFPRLRQIADGEKIKASDNLLKRIAVLCNGDMRKPITNYLEKLTSYNGNQIPDDIKLTELLSDADRYAITITKTALNGELVESTQHFINSLKFFRIKDLIPSIIEHIRLSKKYPNEMKADMLISIGDMDNLLNGGSSNEVALTFLIGKFYKAGKSYIPG